MKRWIVIAYWLFWPRQYECEFYWDACMRLRVRHRPANVFSATLPENLPKI